MAVIQYLVLGIPHLHQEINRDHLRFRWYESGADPEHICGRDMWNRAKSQGRHTARSLMSDSALRR